MNKLVAIEDRFAGSLLGLAVGDALGAPFEGRPADAICRRYQSASKLIENPPPGELWYTDDTQMMIGVAQTLIDCGTIDESDICNRFVANFVPQRGYGRGARLVLDAMAQGHDYQHLASTLFPGGSFGNGAAMRVAPVGLMFRHDDQLLWQLARLSALPTHVHPLGIEGAQLLALAVAMASRSEAIQREPFLNQLADRCSSLEYSGPLRRSATVEDPRDLALFGSGIAATDSVVTAIASFALAPESFVDTIGNVILLGGDTDTLAAMAGAISGAYLGVSAIPEHLIECLEDRHQGKTYIEQLSQGLCAAHRHASM